MDDSRSDFHRSTLDLIDFQCSDSYRDHYAAQGMTYPSGRREPAISRQRYLDLKEACLEWRLRALEAEARCAQLEAATRNANNHHPAADGLKLSGGLDVRTR